MDIVIAIISIDWYKLMNYKERVENEKKLIVISFLLQLQLAEKDKEINGLTSHLEKLSREKVLNNPL